jgi:hypothetical protein
MFAFPSELVRISVHLQSILCCLPRTTALLFGRSNGEEFSKSPRRFSLSVRNGAKRTQSSLSFRDPKEVILAKPKPPCEFDKRFSSDIEKLRSFVTDGIHSPSFEETWVQSFS